ncbi:glycosyl hydrolase [Asticcacaulis sp. AC460]|nr:glycosyl hydrolase [Asticcacaulis sp. AC460]
MVVALSGGLAACGGASAGGGGGGGTSSSSSSSSSSSLIPSSVSAQVWQTNADQSKLLAKQSDSPFNLTAASGVVITVDSTQTYQTMVGFGASMTDASAYLIRNRMSASQRDTLMAELFGKDGLDLSFTRLTIGASDFSQTHYTYDDMPAGATDPTLAHFSLAPAKTDVIPAIKQALALNDHMTVMASPWSAPGWMKSTDSLIKGSLNPSAYGPFADYLVRYVTEMKAEGVPIKMLTLQNEPHFEPDSYPGMNVTAASRAAFIGGHLGPKLASAGLDVKILDHDHNWDLAASPTAVLGDPVANPYVAGVAWHCYGGDVSAQSTVHDAYPTKDAYFTECSGGAWAADFGPNFGWQMKNLIIGSTRNWAKGVLMWNLALDESHGPHLGGCGDCRGVVTINSATGDVTRNLEYYALGHVSKFVKPGAVRISSNSSGGLDTVAFKNTDGTIALVLLNSNATATAFSVVSSGSGMGYTLPAGAAATFTWKL